MTLNGKKEPFQIVTVARAVVYILSHAALTSIPDDDWKIVETSIVKMFSLFRSFRCFVFSIHDIQFYSSSEILRACFLGLNFTVFIFQEIAWSHLEEVIKLGRLALAVHPNMLRPNSNQ